MTIKAASWLQLLVSRFRFALFITILLAVTSPRFSSLAAAQLTESSVAQFIDLLCRGDRSVADFVDSNESKLCVRLGIRYGVAPNKFLIAQDLDSAVKAAIVAGKQSPGIQLSALDEHYQKLTLSISALHYSREFYFRDGKWILPSTYFSRNWSRLESEHFRFIASDSLEVCPYCIERLEQFFDSTAGRIGYSAEQLKQIQEEKVEYLLCRDPWEVLTLTGYESRGMYELASDRIITCYSAHYHELVHLLVNYRLGSLPLRTHPLLQEGIAVALGGRGGIDPPVAMDMAAYLVESEMAYVDELLSTEGFNQTNSSISYPVAGLYCDFLLREIGTARFLELYRKYSGTDAQLKSMVMEASDLPAQGRWGAYVKQAATKHLIDVATSDSDFAVIYRDSNLVVSEGLSQFLIRTTGTSGLGRIDSLKTCRSEVFADLFGQRAYRGEKYAVVANADEIKIYNLYTGNLIANLVGAFRIPPVTISRYEGYYRFVVDKSVFDDDFVRTVKAMGEL